ncbi:unnamed protein product, partial [Penicillium nalgiovense]
WNGDYSLSHGPLAVPEFNNPWTSPSSPSRLSFFLFSSLLLTRKGKFVFASSLLPDFKSITPLLLFFGHTVYRQSTHYISLFRFFAFSLYSLNLAQPCSHSGSDVLSFIYLNFFRFHKPPYDYIYAPVYIQCPSERQDTFTQP